MRRDRLAAAALIVAGATLAGCASEPQPRYSTFVRAPAGAEAPATVALPNPQESGCVVYFDVNSAEVRADQLPTIDRCAALYADWPQAHLVLEGHADERGSSRHNLDLGKRRAEAVQQQLLQRGLPAERLSVATLGEEAFPEIQGDENLWSRSRRVDFALR